jgi:hypothetical protein
LAVVLLSPDRERVDWILVGDQKHCKRHPEVGPFSKLDVCPRCIDDPGPAIERSEPERIDAESIADEKWFSDRAEQLWGYVAALTTAADGLPKKSRIQYSTIAKVADTALKFKRAAVEERRRRGEHDHERWLVKQCRELARRGVAN